MNFLKNVLASMIGTIVAMVVVGVIFFFLIIAAVVSAGSGGEERTNVSENSVLHLKLDQAIVERAGENDFNFNPATFQSEETIGLNHIVEDLAHAKTDDNIKGIFLEVSSVGAAPSTVLDIRNAIIDFKSSGKWVIAYAENYSQAGYYVASAANEVYMYPTGTFDWRGLATEIMFYKNMLDKLEIEAQVIRGPNNKFKSAVEPFMYDHMSPENREQIATFVGDIWNIMLDGIAKERGVTKEMLNLAADSLTFRDVQLVKDAGLLNGLLYRDEVMDLIKTKVGVDKVDDIKFADFGDYHRSYEKTIGTDRVAVVYAVGGIESGEGDDQTIGSDRIAKALRDAREDSNVKAVVLRVNSPGGSALASDVIWRETELIKKSGKPFIVSMGDYAASGGYYIACSADRIFANPNTITGSIGVFGVIPNMKNFLNNKIGLTFDTYQTNAHAGLISVTKPLDEMEMKAMQDMIADIYDDFTSKVAKGRNKTQAEVDSIGQGRVWSGEDALQIGLVDELGDLKAAVAYAAQQAGIADYSTKGFPKMKDPFEELMEDLTGQKQTAILQQVLGDDFRFYEEIQAVRAMKGPQARLPFALEIR
ncbi:MAG: signal peptide peptidase SppA [Flavobacteriales bacterium]